MEAKRQPRGQSENAKKKSISRLCYIHTQVSVLKKTRYSSRLTDVAHTTQHTHFIYHQQNHKKREEKYKKKHSHTQHRESEYSVCTRCTPTTNINKMVEINNEKERKKNKNFTTKPK